MKKEKEEKKKEESVFFEKFISMNLLNSFIQENKEQVEKYLKNGDIQVQTYDFDENILQFKPIQNIREIVEDKNDKNYIPEYYKIYLENSSSIICSDRHMFYVGSYGSSITKNNLSFKFAATLSAGNVLYTLDQNFNSNILEKTKITKIEKLEEPVKLYDLQIKDGVYLTNGILSHNSTINSAITYGLYGKSGNKKNINELPNRINKALEVELSLNTDLGTNEEIKIHRGVQPNIFNVKIGTDELNVAGKKNVQEILEKEYYGIPYYIFNNIISLSINDFKSFLNMNPADKRSIIDKILGLEILNKMLEFNKFESKSVKENSDSLTYSKKTAEKNIELTEKTKEEALKKNEKARSEKIEEITSSISNIEDSLKISREELSKLKDKQNKIVSKTNEYYSTLSHLKAEKHQLDLKLKLLSNDTCPSCQAPLNSEFHLSLRDTICSDKNVLEEQYNKIQETYNKLNSASNNNNKKIVLLNSEISNIENTIHKYNFILNEANKESIGTDLNALDEMIRNFKETILSNENILNELSIMISIHGIIENILGDSGVKSQIIKSIIPLLNHSIEFYLNEMNINFHIQFDENFTPIIFDENSIQISSETFSTGELKKVDFAILLSIIKIFKTKYPSLNLIFLDEIFSSVDEDGRSNIIRILKEFSKDTRMHIFVINHSELPIELFNSIIEVKKENGFSKIKQIKSA
jgi:DNA repair exonuclease SbcCD ATPase subunit